MGLRSILFVPADSEKKFLRAGVSGADVVVLDLEDSVAPARKDYARGLARAVLLGRAAQGPKLWVRINALDTSLGLPDLAAVVAGRPDAILLPKAGGATDVRRLDDLLSILEVRDGVDAGAVKIVTVATETPEAVFGLASYVPRLPRLLGLTWGAEDLAAAVGATSNHDEAGLTPLYQIARALCLLAAARAEVLAIDTVCMSLADTPALQRDCRAARRDGFSAKLAIHPDQVEVINAAFTPSEEEVQTARAIVHAYETDPDLGTFQLGGRMIDIPHLKQALKLLNSLK